MNFPKIESLTSDAPNYRMESGSFPRKRQYTVWINSVGCPELSSPGHKDRNCGKYHRILQERYPGAKIVVLSGSTDWAYAKKTETEKTEATTEAK